MATSALLRAVTARQCQCTIPLHSSRFFSQTILPSITTAATSYNATSHNHTNNDYSAINHHHRSFTSSSILFSTNNNNDVIDDDTIPPPSFHQYTEPISTLTNEELSDPTTIPGFTTLIHSPPTSNTTPRHALVGTVVSNKMDKTVNVAVDRYRIIPKYRKRMKYTKKFMAHDEGEECREGDLVMIVPCQRVSKRKHFRVREIIKAKGIL